MSHCIRERYDHGWVHDVLQFLEAPTTRVVGGVLTSPLSTVHHPPGNASVRLVDVAFPVTDPGNVSSKGIQ